MTRIETEERSAALVRAAGLSYFPVALLARLPYAMIVVGVLTLVVTARGELALGGLTSAMAGIGTALFGPLIGALADRIGQRRVVLVSGVLNSLALLGMAWAAFIPAPDVALLAVAFAIGATAPQVSPMSRSRLVGIIERMLPADRHAPVLNGTIAYESAADESVFVFGPFIVGLLATTLNPAAPVIAAAVLALVFVTAFALHPSGATRPLAPEGLAVRQAPVSRLFCPALLVVVVAGVLGMGFFGSTLTALTAFLTRFGHPEQAGLIYGVMGVGSAVLALGVAWAPLRFSLRARWLTFAGLLAAATIALPFAATVPGMLVLLLLAGFGVGPTLVTQYAFAAERSPLGRSATVMNMLGSALVVGQAAASALVGALAPAAVTEAALLAPTVSALVVFAAAAANWFLTGRRSPSQVR
ncbi:MFS transporter [Leifsonia xyli subsp. xyli]|uniref:ABC transporter, permease protein n=2 Tax=Leifsonia xyli subsp. xyli TaxID=59736 RepID=Q6AH64_LEIXX|nr:MFS transporter [Leifsonia xyli]AAT88281.1 ABC transporter, permease protein [Leifsonia xyli subsp. xyli str. CTCB07]ODA90179.1 MFS transporter [Leifsonia xyli subsp. xyli]